jgi:hypothetical protein
VAAGDPNPLVAGNGLRILQAAGVLVTSEPNEMADELIEAHGMYTVNGRPFVTLMLAAPRAVSEVLLKTSDMLIRADAESPSGTLSNDYEPQLLTARPGYIDTRTGATHGTWLDVLKASRAASLLLATSGDISAEPAVSELLSNGLVDKVVAGCNVPLPHGFKIVRSPATPEPHVIAYARG